jgi:hypothetical protein
VPLSRVSELLAAGEAEFAAAVEEIDRRLQAEILEREQHRERIARLAAGDSLALPPEAVSYLDQLRKAGVQERMVEAERDAWILVAAQLPGDMPFYMRLKSEQLNDPSVRALYADLAEMIEWSADDPRLIGVVDRLVAQFEAVPDEAWEEEQLPQNLADLLDSVFLDSVPAAARILQLLRERGWSGWTNLERIQPRR